MRVYFGDTQIRSHFLKNDDGCIFCWYADTQWLFKEREYVYIFVIKHMSYSLVVPMDASTLVIYLVVQDLESALLFEKKIDIFFLQMLSFIVW